jgi:hypothetical protein
LKIYYVDNLMTHQIRNRIIRNATAEEKERHGMIRAEIEQELPVLKEWARAAANRHPDRIPVGTVFSAEETEVVQAIDSYAAAHSLAGRSAVVREALSKLLGVQIAPH